MSARRSTKRSTRSPRKYQIFKRAYTILGHGGDSEEEIDVPSNCMVITLALPGDQTSVKGDTIPRLRKMMQLQMSVLLNPLDHPKQIFEAFGPLTFYGPGAKCPNFVYKLGEIYKTTEHGLKKYIALQPSGGLVNIATMQQHANIATIGHLIRQPQHTNEITDTLAHIFQNSVYPQEADIRQLLSRKGVSIDVAAEELAKSQDPTEVINKTMQYGLKKIYNSPLIIRTQQELFQDFPGIYYNFLCRDVGLVDTDIYNQGNRLLNATLRPTALTHIPSRNEIAMNEFKPLTDINHVPMLGSYRKLLKRRLSNTLKRRHQVRNYYTSDYYRQKRLAEYDQLQGAYDETAQQLADLQEVYVELYARAHDSEEAYQNAVAAFEHMQELQEDLNFGRNIVARIPHERASFERKFHERSTNNRTNKRSKHSIRRHSAH
jgi:hypothetical protein